LRSIGEALNTKINWNEAKKQVEIGEPPKEEVIPTVAPMPTPWLTLGKNEFITREKPPRFKITNFGAQNSGFEAQYLKENPDYKVISDTKLKPGEVISGIAGYQVNREESKKRFSYNGEGIYYEE
jgi:hypothetical protein